jgi:hypothetical protein
VIKYKLTNQKMQTHNGFQWEMNKWVETSGEGALCTNGWLHCYDNPLLAVVLNPIHADISSPRIFECAVEGKEKHNKGLKSGYSRMRLTRERVLPEISINTRVRFGILCALQVYKNESFVNWAKDWLSGNNRAAAWAANAAAAAAAAAEIHIDLPVLLRQAIKEEQEMKA